MNKILLSYNNNRFSLFCLLKYFVRMHRFLKPWRLFLYLIWFLYFLWSSVFWLFWKEGDLVVNDTITIQDWDTLNTLYEQVTSWKWLLQLKRWYKKNQEVLSVLQPWTYQFSWAYTFTEFFEFLSDWPQISYLPLTILEWWSIYDVDDYLVRESVWRPWEYVDIVTNPVTIEKYKAEYRFLDESWDIASLEWFLYPETYYVDASKDILDQLIVLQLKQFQKDIRDAFGDQIDRYPSKLSKAWFDVNLWVYDLITLASVIEKEERLDENKTKIASVFLNRIDTWMRIDADITLCYGLGEWYETCTPDVIVQNLQDAENPYNTRAVSWLPPSPISNIHVSSLKWMLEAEKTSNFYYLHDSKGKIYLAKDLSWHNRNKSKYLQ